jgi:KEOPS complex subunit Pcc1
VAAPHVIEFEFDYDRPAMARTVERSLAQEVGEIDDDRSTTTVARAGSKRPIWSPFVRRRIPGCH